MGGPYLLTGHDYRTLTVQNDFEVQVALRAGMSCLFLDPGSKYASLYATTQLYTLSDGLE